MNGRITIELSGDKTPLTFGMMAVEEFASRQAIGSTGWAKLMTDLVYAGYCNEEIVNGNNPAKDYRQIAEGVEELIISKSPILNDVYECFEQSKAGAELLGNVKKKEDAEPKPKAKKETPK